MLDNDEECHVLRGLFNALLLEGFSVIVIIGLIKIVFALIYSLL